MIYVALGTEPGFDLHLEAVNDSRHFAVNQYSVYAEHLNAACVTCGEMLVNS